MLQAGMRFHIKNSPDYGVIMDLVLGFAVARYAIKMHVVIIL